MYQVVTMYGDNEPWWFFEDWQKDVEEEVEFDSLEEATAYYKEKWELNCSSYSYINAKKNYLAAFWNAGEERWCEECDDDLQQYRGIALLRDHQAVTVESGRELYETTNSSGETKRCQRPKQSTWS